MKPVKFEGYNVAIGEGQEEYIPIPAQAMPDDPQGKVLMCFELDPDEIKEIQETGRLWMTKLTFGMDFQPIMLNTKKPEFDGEGKG